MLQLINNKIDSNKLPFALKVSDVAFLLGIGRDTAYNLVRSEGFPAILCGRRYVIPRDAFLRWVDETAYRKKCS